MKLKVGTIVGYKPTATEMGLMRERRSVCNIQEDLPAVIVAIDPENETVNLKVLLDGQGDIWATGVKQGEEVGQFDFYPTEEDDLIRDYAYAVNGWQDAKAELKDLIKDLETAKNELKEELADVLPKIEVAKEKAIKASSVNEPALTSGDAKKV